MFNNSVVLITGGTGSFGQTLAAHFLKTDVKEIRIFSRDEKKQDELRLHYSNDKLKFYIGDVRDYRSIKDAMSGVDYVFHAAALKQVPSCEFYPLEAIKTNVLGTENVLDAASKYKVKKVVLLSTDKAVYPINAMGMSKAIAEKVLRAKSKSITNGITTFCATRYGNVMASRGSVIPLFISQIKSNKIITLTDPNMTRFLMTLEESVKLVLHAFRNGEQGDIFIQKSPSAKIGDLAIALKEIFNAHNEIKVIGTRHGEKLYETLISREEMAFAKEINDYFCLKSDKRDLNYAKYFSEGQELISEGKDYTSHNTKILTIDQIKDNLLELDYINEALK